jgi:hypothetical protein
MFSTPKLPRGAVAGGLAKALCVNGEDFVVRGPDGNLICFSDSTDLHD